MKAGIVASVAEEEETFDELREESISPALDSGSLVLRGASVAPSVMHGKVRNPGGVHGPVLEFEGVHGPLEETDEAQEAVAASCESL